MNNLTDNYWNNRYETNDFGWDVGEVSLPLKTYIEQLHHKNLTILIPGAGNAYEAEFLFHKGFQDVNVLDFAETPLQNIKKRVPDFPENQLIHQDFFEHQGQYDLILEQTFFCALHPSLRARYVQHMYQLLKPNGKLVGVLFNDVLNDNKPPFGGNKQEYEDLFSSSFHIKIMEPCYNSIKPRQNRELFIMMQKQN
ncbi:MAG: methyltransferase domain-containing protein [Bacteroidetes bacterium]|nr:methyltransferase domain-containing protein [Bacteroidota bacterium]